jgi:hypothetical protein
MFTFTLRWGPVGICAVLPPIKENKQRYLSSYIHCLLCIILFRMVSHVIFHKLGRGGDSCAFPPHHNAPSVLCTPSQPSIHRVRLFSSLSPTSSYLEKVATSVIRLVIVHSPIFYSASRCLPLEIRNYRLAASAVIRRHPMVPLLDPRGQQSGLRGESPKITFPPGQRRIRHSYRRSLRKTPFLPSPTPSRNTNQMARASW